MLKPLLRVNPKLSGNMKLSCFVTDYELTSDKNSFDCHVRAAKLYPLSHKLMQYDINVNLLGSSYEYDVKKFYKKYSDIFYTNQNAYNQVEIQLIDKTLVNDPRNVDFEMGCKRVSYIKSNNTYAFMAPIYIDSYESIPYKFQIKVVFIAKNYKTIKYINIRMDDSSSTKDYLYKYLNKYLSKIDNQVITCDPVNNCAYYHAIDCMNGGFVDAKDSVIKSIYNQNNSINNFDALICNGYDRNHLVIKQIIPLCFYFDLDDILTDQEKKAFEFRTINIQGNYFIDEETVSPWYDLSMNYDNYVEDVLQYSPSLDKMVYKHGINVMCQPYPSMLENTFSGYNYSNKIAPTYQRWKLQQSSDEHPYIINNSYAFTKLYNRGSIYGEYPSRNITTYSFINIIDPDNCNLILPADTDVYEKNTGIIDFTKYKSIYLSNYNKYSFNWYDTYVGDNDFQNIKETVDWCSVERNKTLYNGILYNFSNLKDEDGNSINIDKFSILMNTLIIDNKNAFTADHVICKTDLNSEISYLNDEFNINSISGLIYDPFHEDSSSTKISFKDNVKYKEDEEGKFIKINQDLDDNNRYYSIELINSKLKQVIDEIYEINENQDATKTDTIYVVEENSYPENNHKIYKLVKNVISTLKSLYNEFTNYTTRYGLCLLDVTTFNQYLKDNSSTVFDTLINDNIDNILVQDVSDLLAQNLYNSQATQETNQVNYDNYLLYNGDNFSQYDKTEINEKYISENTLVYKMQLIYYETFDSILKKYQVSEIEIGELTDLSELLNQVNTKINYIKDFSDELTKYNFYPTYSFNDNIICTNIYIQELDNKDDDYIYVDPYNLSNILSGSLTEYYSEESIDSYNKILNKDHLLIYYYHIAGKSTNDLYARYKCINIDYQDSYSSLSFKDKLVPIESIIDIQFNGTQFYYEDDETNVFDIVYEKELYRVKQSLLQRMIDEKINKNGYYDSDLYLYVKELSQDYQSKISLTINSEDKNIGNVYRPLFDSPRYQRFKDTVTYNELVSSNITIDSDGYARLMHNDSKYLYECSEEELSNLSSDIDRYSIIDYPKISFSMNNKANSTIFNKYNLNIVKDSDTTYAFYYISLIIDNTDQSFNMYTKSGLVPKYISAINNLELDKIQSDKKYINRIYPFLKTNIFSIFSNLYFKVDPKKFKIDVKYHAYYQPYTNDLESTIIYYDNILSKMTNYRYIDDITPLIQETSIIKDIYNIKYKLTSNTLLKSGSHKWNNDYTLYKNDININTFEGLRIYNEYDPTTYNTYYPLEFKNFNYNQMINLPKSITYEFTDLMTYDELLENESSSKVFLVFKSLLNNIENITDDEVKFLLLKYKIEYDSEFISIDEKLNEKLYSLKYNFKLL